MSMIDENIEEFDEMDEIAIIGMAGRYPGAPNLEKFWQNLKNGVESTKNFTEEELLEAGIKPSVLADKDYVRAGTMIDDVENFDAAFFGISPREAAFTDPQHRLFLECAHTALEDAGINPAGYGGTVSVYGGNGSNSYLLSNVYPTVMHRKELEDIDFQVGTYDDHLTTRVSYKLNLTGSSVSVQTACSTSLVATYMACEALMSHQCDVALAGGVTVLVPNASGYMYVPGGVASPDGHCRTFDANSEGTFFSSGVGIVVLKRLADALRDGDRIDAIVKGWAINNDGSQKIGYTAPSIEGQRKAIEEALALADVNPDTIDYVEAHGTGTKMGDPIEVTALTRAYRSGTDKKNYCQIGSVKTNIGHTAAAAGVTGLIKTVLSMRHKMIPGTLHFKTPNPNIDFANSPFFVNSELSEWQRNGSPRRAGISSFGVGGTNAHVIVEEAPVVEASDDAKRPFQLMLLSAKNDKALDEATDNLKTFLINNPDVNLADVAHTLQVGRETFSQRRGFACTDAADAVATLEKFDRKRIFTQNAGESDPSIVFMFPGGGAQYPNMGLGLYETEPLYRAEIDRCLGILKNNHSIELKNLLFPAADQVEQAAEALQRPDNSILTIFITEYALAKLWMSWGIQPESLTGHSLGEYTAACLAGVFSLEDALRIVTWRGQIFESMPEGGMLSLFASEDVIRPLLTPDLAIAVINNASMCVVSGERQAINRFAEQLDPEIEFRRIKISVAAHSAVLDPFLADFEQRLADIQFNTPNLPFISNMHGTWAKAEEVTQPQYWVQHLRNTVRFADGLSELLKDPKRVMLEVGPGKTLSGLVRQHADKGKGRVVVSSMRHPKEEQADTAFMLNSLGQLWAADVTVDWAAFHSGERRVRLGLPTYPFQRQRYWIDPPKGGVVMQSAKANMGKKANVADWFYVPSWKRMPAERLNLGDLEGNRRNWLVFVDEMGLGSQLVARLEREGQDVTTVSIANQFAELNNRVFTLNPHQPDGYDKLMARLIEQDCVPDAVAHLWSVTALDSNSTGLPFFEESQARGFYSLAYLAQALGRHDVMSELRLTAVANHIHDVSGNEELVPEKATILGICKSIPQEHINVSCESIDVIMPKAGLNAESVLISQLLAQMTAEKPGQAMALRGNHQWAQTYEAHPISPAETGKSSLKTKGVYMITGGMGRIGLALADHLAKNVQARLVLLGRSEFPAQRQWKKWLKTHDEDDSTSTKIKKLQEIEAAGGKVIYVSADVTDRKQMTRAVAAAKKKFGRLNGVIHAAAITGDDLFCTIRELDYEAGMNQMRPKALGMYTLHEVLAKEKLDFCLMTSSLSVVLGGLGLGTYSSANHFMDTFIHKIHKEGTQSWFGLNWDHWHFPQDDETIAITLAELSMEPEEGLDTFDRVMGHTDFLAVFPQVLVSTGDIQARIDQWVKLESLKDSSDDEVEDAAPRYSRPELSSDFEAPRNETEQSIANIWQDVLGVDKVGIHDSFFDLGGESLIAIQMFGKIEKMTGKKFPMSTLFDAPTVSMLAERVYEKKIWMQPYTHLVPINAKGNKKPFFCVAAVGNEILHFKDLARYLDPERPFYGFQQALDRGHHGFGNIEELAAAYIKEMKMVQPEGPYHLGGYCFGGTVAYEMAQQMKETGDELEELILIDTETPNAIVLPSLSFTEKFARSFRNLKDHGLKEEVSYVRERLFHVYYFQIWDRYANFSRKLFGKMGWQMPEHLKDARQMNYKALEEYVPGAYEDEVILFQAQERHEGWHYEPMLGWDKYAKAVVHEEIPGGHASLWEEPNVQTFAKKLQERLNQGERADVTSVGVVSETAVSQNL